LEVIKKYNIDQVYHLAAVLSAVGEKNPDHCFNVNINSLKNILDIARDLPLKKVFWASSIAAFGPSAPRELVPQNVILDPLSIYGITKVSGEMLCAYYHRKFGVDVRSLRYPAILSHTRQPNGSLVDMFTEIFRYAARDKKYDSYFPPEATQSVMYITDTVDATLQLMDAESSKITVRTSYNIQGDSYSVSAMVNEIKKYIPDFVCSYTVDPNDFRLKMLNSIPQALDDSVARHDWDWKPKFGLAEITKELVHLFSTQPSN